MVEYRFTSRCWKYCIKLVINWSPPLQITPPSLSLSLSCYPCPLNYPPLLLSHSFITRLPYNLSFGFISYLSSKWTYANVRSHLYISAHLWLTQFTINTGINNIGWLEAANRKGLNWRVWTQIAAVHLPNCYVTVSGRLYSFTVYHRTPQNLLYAVSVGFYRRPILKRNTTQSVFHPLLLSPEQWISLFHSGVRLVVFVTINITFITIITTTGTVFKTGGSVNKRNEHRTGRCCVYVEQSYRW